MAINRVMSVMVLLGGSMLGFVPSSSGQANAVLEEIIVTAQRREESLQSVPISVTAVTDDFMVKNDVRSLEDLNGTVPGFYATNSVGYAAAPLTIRGIGGANGGGNFFNDEPVAVYVNDVYISRLSFSTADLVDVDSIQVLRGPQGTLYGRNSTAGALLLSTARPTEDFEAHIKAGIAEHDEIRVSGAVSGGLSDSIQARMAVAYSDRDGWANNTSNGSKLASSEDQTVRLSLRYTASDVFEANVILEAQERESAPATIAVANVVPRTPSTPFVRRPDLDALIDNSQFALNDPNNNESETTSATLLLDWYLGALTLDSVTSARIYELDGFQDSDGTQFTLFSNNGGIESEQFSQELRLASNGDGPLSWLIGVHYLAEESEMIFAINNFQGLFGAGTNANFNAAQDTDAWAVFADVTWQITDQASLLLGARYSDETKDFNNSLFVQTVGNSIPLPIPFGPFPAGGTIPAGVIITPTTTVNLSDDFSDFTPRIVFNYQFSDSILGYVSYSESFKSGGFNSFGLAPAFENEEIEAFEVGLKSDLLNGSFRFNVAAFSYDYTNLQVRLPVPTGGVSIQNAGTADVQGAELELGWAISDRLTLSANATFLDAELKEFLTQEIPEDLQFLIGAPIPLNSVNAAGNDLTRAPELQYFISMDYQFPVTENLSGNVNLNYRHQDAVFFLETNQSRNTFKSDDTDELSVRVTLAPNNNRWELGVFAQNLTNERTITQVTALGGHPNAAISEPRKLGVDLRVNF